MGLESILGAGASLLGGAMGSDAASDAADAQVQASREATKAQREMFDKQVELQKPWRDFGGLGVNRLAYELGLSRTPVYSAAGPIRSEQEIRNQLRSQFQSGPTGAPSGGGLRPGSPEFQAASPADQWAAIQAHNNPSGPFGIGIDSSGSGYLTNMNPGSFDNAGFEAAVAAELAKQEAGQNAPQDYQGAEYGGLLRNFSAKDLYDDPSYQFRMNEGLKARTSAYAGRGNFLSGAAAKGLERYGQDYASTEYGKAFDRYNVNNANKFNRLASVAGVGQTSANQTGAAASNFGQQMGNNIIGAGNAAAAGQVGSANAWSSGLGGAFANYQQNELMKTLRQPVSYPKPVPMYPGAEY